MDYNWLPVETISGDIATFETVAMPVESLIAEIKPVQSGSGDPSPDNIRPISGWDEVNVYVSPTTSAEDGTNYNVDLGQTVYAGTLNVTTGRLVITHGYVSDLGSLNWSMGTIGSEDVFMVPLTGMKRPASSSDVANMICSHYPTTSYVERRDRSLFALGSSNNIYIIDSNYSTVSSFRYAVTGAQLVYELNTYTSVSLDPAQVQTLIGQNNIWVDSGNVEVTVRCVPNEGVFCYNGRASSEFGVRVERFPDLNRSARKFKSASVSGRNGNIYQLENAWEEVTVSYQIFAGERSKGAALTSFTEIVEWLNSADDYAELLDTFDLKHYRMGVFVDDMEIESQWHTFGRATVRFRCRPQRYLASNGKIAKSEVIHFENGTSTNYGITTSIYNDTVTMSGTVSNAPTPFGSIYIDPTQDTMITITQDMVDKNGYFYLNNSTAIPAEMTVTSGASVIWIRADNAPAYYKRKLQQSDVGNQFTRFDFLVTNGNAINVTFSPKIVYEEDATYPADLLDGDQLYNPTNHIAFPIITMQGEGDVIRSLLDLNSRAMTTSGVASIPHDLLSGADYFQPVVNLYKQGYCCWIRHNTSTPNSPYSYVGSSGTSGTLTTIDNETGTVTFTPESTSLWLAIIFPAIPSSQYRLTCNVSSNDAMIKVMELESSGRNRYFYGLDFNASNGKIDFIIDSFPETGYFLFLFMRRSGSGSVSFSNIMLERGTDAHEFAPNRTTTPRIVSINDIQLQFFANGFSNAVIDCERENFTIDGVNANNTSKVLDLYGNESVDFLRLDKGANQIGLSSGITSAKIEPRYWEL